MMLRVNPLKAKERDVIKGNVRLGQNFEKLIQLHYKD